MYYGSGTSSPFNASEIALGFNGHGVDLGQKDLLGDLKAIAVRYHEGRFVLVSVENAIRERFSMDIKQALESGAWRDDISLYQPLMLGISLAFLQALLFELRVSLQELASKIIGVSAGELIGLTAADAWTVADASRLLMERGDCITSDQPTSDTWVTHMLRGPIPERLEQLVDSLCRIGTDGWETLAITNDNTTDQVIISGEEDDVKRLQENLVTDGHRIKFRRFDLPRVFHHKAQRAAAAKFELVVETSEPRAPMVDVLSNVTGKPHDSKHIARSLGAHLRSCVRLVACKRYLKRNGVQHVIAIGPGPIPTLLKGEFPEQVMVVDSLEAVHRVKEQLLRTYCR